MDGVRGLSIDERKIRKRKGKKKKSKGKKKKNENAARTFFKTYSQS